MMHKPLIINDIKKRLKILKKKYGQLARYVNDDCPVLSYRPSLVTDSLPPEKCRLWLLVANATQRNDERSLTV
jgi:hypothetical protein